MASSRPWIRTIPSVADDRAFVAGFGFKIKFFDLAFDQFADLGWIELHSGFSLDSQFVGQLLQAPL